MNEGKIVVGGPAMGYAGLPPAFQQNTPPTKPRIQTLMDDSDKQLAVAFEIFGGIERAVDRLQSPEPLPAGQKGESIAPNTLEARLSAHSSTLGELVSRLSSLQRRLNALV